MKYPWCFGLLTNSDSESYIIPPSPQPPLEANHDQQEMPKIVTIEHPDIIGQQPFLSNTHSPTQIASPSTQTDIIPPSPQ